VGFRISGRGEASQRFEGSVEVKQTHACLLRQLFESWRLFGSLDQSTCLCDLGGIFRSHPQQVWFASFARPKSCFFGVLARQVVLHVFRPGETGATGWPAIDAGRLDRIEELPIPVGIATHDRLPSRIPLDFVREFKVCSCLAHREFLSAYITTLATFPKPYTPVLALEFGQQAMVKIWNVEKGRSSSYWLWLLSSGMKEHLHHFSHGCLAT
jgi:hypothetical protein